MSILPDQAPNNPPTSSGWRALDLHPTDVDHALHRFARLVDAAGGPDACWPWIGYRHPNGYGIFRVSGSKRTRRMCLVHRVAWVLYTGRSLIDQLTIDHLCYRRECVNPRHLEPVTIEENKRRYVVRRAALREGAV